MPDGFVKTLAGATVRVRYVSGVFPLREDWPRALGQIAHALAEHTKDGMRLDRCEAQAIEGAIAYFQIALKNSEQNNEHLLSGLRLS